MLRVVVIGGGPAGVTAALHASELGADVTLVESGHLGGTCTNDGCVPTRVLAKAARLVRDTEQLAAYGIAAERPYLDFARLIERTQDIVYKVHEKKQLISRLRGSSVKVLTDVGEVSFLYPNTLVLADGNTLRADRFIVCAGGHARRLSVPGSEYAMTHSDVWSLRELPRSVVIVGAAATGCQLASIFGAFGTRVHLLEVAPRILAAEDEAVSEAIGSAFTARGIEVVTAIRGIERIERQDDTDDVLVLYAKDGGSDSIVAEAVVTAVGWPGNTEGLNLPAAGVDTERGYIRVNEALQTSAPHVYAAGDITGRMMLVQSASAEGEVAAENAVLGTESRYTHLIVPHGGFTDPEYGSVGLTESRARDLHDSVVAAVPYADLDRAVIDGKTEGFCKLVVDRATRRVLGAHLAGEQAVEIVQIVAAGMAAGITVDEFAALELAYPTFTSIVGLTARRLVAKQFGPSSLDGRPASDEWEWREAV